MSNVAVACGLFVWHDLMTPDPNAAIGFYTKVAGWGTQKWDGPQPYTMWTAGMSPLGGVMQLPEGAGGPPHWIAYVSSPDVDATVAKATGLGGKVLVAPQDIPSVGRFAIMSDPMGASFAIFTPSGEAPAPQGMPKTGEFSWHELATTDPAAAFSFYEALFGWQKTSAMDMGEQGIYQMFGVGEVPFGGIYRKTAEMPGPPAWLHYIQVDDVHRVAEVIKNEGGQVINGPMEVPGGDWIAQAIDPQGGLFAVHSKKKA